MSFSKAELVSYIMVDGEQVYDTRSFANHFTYVHFILNLMSEGNQRTFSEIVSRLRQAL